MHPWAAYLITKDTIDREDRRRRAHAAAKSAPAPTPSRVGGMVGVLRRPVRAMGCVV